MISEHIKVGRKKCQKEDNESNNDGVSPGDVAAVADDGGGDEREIPVLSELPVRCSGYPLGKMIS